MSNEKGQVIISIAELLVLNSLAGIEVDLQVSTDDINNEDYLNALLVIEQDVSIHNDDGKVIYEGIASYFEEYREEGWQPLRLTSKGEDDG